MYVLVYSDLLGGWTLITKKNYESRIHNPKETDYFSKRDGFQSTADVINYLVKQFDFSFNQITCVDC